VSYDVWLSPSADEPYAEGSTEWLNYTSNVAPMWRAAGVDLAECHGRPAAQVAEGLMGALAAMDDDPDRFRAMDPPNGWGDFDGCRTYLRKILAACLLMPSGYVFVSR
jgi:hypothetical protein